MFNLFEILQSQAGPGMQSIGQQFGLTPEQSRSAMDALLPALAAGLQRSAASDPMGFGRMLGMAGANPYFSAPPQPQAPAQLDFLGQLFGSSMLNQAVLQQASATSGIGQQALRQMLPVMAGMVVAGIVHVLVNQPPPVAAPPQRHVPPPESGFPVPAFWNDWINQFLPPPDGASASAAGKPKATEPAPIADAPPPEVRRPEARNEAETSEDAPFETFQQMFQTGVQVQEQNAKAMQDIFDAFWSPPPDTQDADPSVTELRNTSPGPIGDAAEKATGARKRPPRRDET